MQWLSDENEYGFQTVNGCCLVTDVIYHCFSIRAMYVQRSVSSLPHAMLKPAYEKAASYLHRAATSLSKYHHHRDTTLMQRSMVSRRLESNSDLSSECTTCWSSSGMVGEEGSAVPICSDISLEITTYRSFIGVVGKDQDAVPICSEILLVFQ
jgi:hypothetical protein